MSTYVIGDVQGCFDSLQALLSSFDFDARVDRLWFVGDLVNRGPKSLEVLRWVRSLGDRAVAVMGNHDLHLLACAAAVAAPRRRDTVDAILRAPDRDELLRWLVRRPLLYREGDWVLVHAGLYPGWTLTQHEQLALSIEGELAGAGAVALLRAWRSRDRVESSAGVLVVGGSVTERRAFGLDVLTRMRCIRDDGSLDLTFSGSPEQAGERLRPWYESYDFGPRRVVFGHWAALGVREGAGWISLDSGCIWGNGLTAYRLDDGAVFHQQTIDS